MRDWNDTQTVRFVVVGVTAHILKRYTLGFTGSTLITIRQILTCKHFCLSEGFQNDYKCGLSTRKHLFCMSFLHVLAVF